jgi:hypothetical protein
MPCRDYKWMLTLLRPISPIWPGILLLQGDVSHKWYTHLCIKTTQYRVNMALLKSLWSMTDMHNLLICNLSQTGVSNRLQYGTFPAI